MITNVENQYFIYNSNGITSEAINIHFMAGHSNNNYIIHRAYVAQTAKSRQGTSSTKTRSEVRGGGKKPWKQKGTGRARAGSNRSPLWRGGGIIFGPNNRKYTKKINKKERVLAINACLANKRSKIIVTHNSITNLSKPSTQFVLQILKKCGISYHKVLIITKTPNTNLYLSIRNIPNIKIILASNINLCSILLAEVILIDKDAIPIITKDSND
uniref:Large ribosomal subunit protein uL4c n=1 Tax=Apophlaea sinclairii TaxID=212746 RepID=A0A1C9CBV8_9FLOR|nr:ribosomal protein L4 [Apophlaea sinclairii]AOM65878.1 ribosomal protein L4 [Apophlaea sinclairii]